MRGILLIAGVFLSGPATGQTFECRMGQNAACLDWGETVCTNGGKCVSESAACFDSYQCDYKDFACKSNVDECVEAHDRIVRDYTALVEDHETLRKAGAELAEGYDDQKGKIESLERDVRDLQKARDEAETCLFLADTLETAKTCLD